MSEYETPSLYVLLCAGLLPLVGLLIRLLSPSAAAGRTPDAGGLPVQLAACALIMLLQPTQCCICCFPRPVGEPLLLHLTVLLLLAVELFLALTPPAAPCRTAALACLPGMLLLPRSCLNCCLNCHMSCCRSSGCCLAASLAAALPCAATGLLPVYLRARRCCCHSPRSFCSATLIPL